MSDKIAFVGISIASFGTVPLIIEGYNIYERLVVNLKGRHAEKEYKKYMASNTWDDPK